MQSLLFKCKESTQNLVSFRIPREENSRMAYRASIVIIPNCVSYYHTEHSHHQIPETQSSLKRKKKHTKLTSICIPKIDKTQHGL
ncbi:hypothetical protein CEXT_788721 [Caerostris extrusa]|uniref:Uncharacterized protein n=1 Tax=Caerostris extrusa TaxID=172846 RepID=A0AAV4XM14_CAEEX|nr:hypothetical protein CEXT_788721 [Caerostris extrusa]